jgi:hypothetical protein
LTHAVVRAILGQIEKSLSNYETRPKYTRKEDLQTTR